VKELIRVLVLINVPIVKYQGNISLGGITVSIVILKDGRRIILENSIYKLFGKSRRGRAKKRIVRVSKLGFVNIHKLDNIIDDELNNLLTSIKFLSINNTVQEGYSVELISALSALFIKAKKLKLIKSNNFTLVERSEIIVNELDSIYLEYLIDSSLNLGFKKENEEIKNILKSYLSESQFILWNKFFDDYCYKEFFRLNGWSFNILEIKKRPTVISNWFIKLVFKQLPDSINLIIDNKSLSKGGGTKESVDLYLAVSSQINTIHTLLKISNNMKELWGYLEIIKQRDNVKIQSPFNFDKNGFTLEPMDDNFLSTFNKKLKVILSVDSRFK